MEAQGVNSLSEISKVSYWARVKETIAYLDRIHIRFELEGPPFVIALLGLSALVREASIWGAAATSFAASVLSLCLYSSYLVYHGLIDQAIQVALILEKSIFGEEAELLGLTHSLRKYTKEKSICGKTRSIITSTFLFILLSSIGLILGIYYLVR